MRRKGEPPRQERAAVYIRVSLDRAASGLQDEIVSPETQRDRCLKYSEAQGWPVVLVEEDIDESGYRQHYSHRPALVRLLDAVERGEITKVVCFKFSRLSRRLKQFLEICDRLESRGAGIVSVTEQIDTGTPAGRLIRNILASFAQFQSEEIAEQIFETWMTKAQRGERPPGLAPFGTLNERGILKPNPWTHHHLVAIYQIYRNSGSVRAAWDYLDQHQVPPPKAAEWNLNTIRGILTNPIYVGRITWAGNLFQARWAPLIDPLLWEGVQGRMRAGRTATAGPSPAAARADAHLLTGLIRCGGCGGRFWTRYAKRSHLGRSHLRRLYWCCSPRTQRRGCAIPAVDGEEVETVVWEAVWCLIASLGASALLGAAPPARAAQRRQARPAAVPGPDLQAARRLLADGSAAIAPATRRSILCALGATLLVTANRVWLHLVDHQVNLQGRRIGETWHFGPAYQRLDYHGPRLTDKQERFLRRCLTWADRAALAEHLGRNGRTLNAVVGRLQAKGDPGGRGEERP